MWRGECGEAAGRHTDTWRTFFVHGLKVWDPVRMLAIRRGSHVELLVVFFAGR
jgi:hypothetical protein